MLITEMTITAAGFPAALNRCASGRPSRQGERLNVMIAGVRNAGRIAGLFRP